MFKTIFQYELRFWLKRPAIYLYSIVFFGMALVFFAGTTGFFDGPSSGQSVEHWYNAPYEIHFILQYFNKFFLFLVPAIVGSAIYRDFQSQTHRLLYSYPLRKIDYLWGRFLAALSMVFLVVLSAALGLILATTLPGLDISKVGPFRLLAYVQSYLVYIFPNLLISSLIVFAVVLRTRNIYAGFGAVLALILLQKILENAFSQQPYFIALTDPFGQNTIAYLTQYWTLAERNTRLLPFNTLVLANRFIWLGIGWTIFGITFQWFRFHASINHLQLIKRKGTPKTSPTSLNPSDPTTTLRFDFSFGSRLKTAWYLSNFDVRYVLHSWLFWSLALLGLATVVFTLNRIINQAEMTMQAATQLILSAPSILFTNVIVLITFVYTGLLFHRERSNKMDGLVDMTPQPNSLFIGAKFLSIVKIQYGLLLLLLLTGIGFQAWNGFYDFKVGLYIFHLLIVVGLEVIIWAIIALFFHTLIPNFYLSLFVLLLGWIGIQGLAALGEVSPLILFNWSKPLLYSDLNGYGIALFPYFYKKFFWLLISLFFGTATYLLWPRGLSESFTKRLKFTKHRLNKPISLFSSLLLIGIGIFAADFHVKTKEGTVYSDHNLNAIYQHFTTHFKAYAHLPQPSIHSVYLELDFFNESQNFSAKGKYQLINTHAFSIDTLLVKSGFDEITQIDLDRPFTIIAEDDNMQFQVIRLEKSLASGDSLDLLFEIQNKPNTFFDRNSNVLDNGTILGQDAFPRLVYPDDGPTPHPSDATSRKRHYQAADADLIRFEAIVSAPVGQTVLAPGTLQRKWTEDQRSYAHFKVDAPIEYSFGFHAGVFERQLEQWQNIPLEVYHHPSHTYNTEQMLAGMKASLSYNQKYFGTYQHKAATIVEFPNSEGSFATTYGNIVPISEVRFLAKVDSDQVKVNLPFYIPAHELTHQWWGSQVLPAHALGALMLTESITEYITLNIYRIQFGVPTAQQFLGLQRQRYLSGRAREQEAEPPLLLVEADQSYIAYGKGAMAFHTLAHYLGEAELNRILRDFLEIYRFQGPPYPTTIDLLAFIERSIPKDLHFILEDYFREVRLHEVKLETTKVNEMINGNFELTAEIDYQKTGSQANTAVQDLLEIGFYDANQQLIDVQQIRVQSGKQQIRFSLTERPSSVQIDPNILLIELNREDNRKGL